MTSVDLAEHIGTILGILTTLLGVAVFLFWRTFVGVEKKCQEIEKIIREILLGSHFANRKDTREEMDNLWTAVNELRKGEWGKGKD